MSGGCSRSEDPIRSLQAAIVRLGPVGRTRSDTWKAFRQHELGKDRRRRRVIGDSMSFIADLRFAFRSFKRAKGLALTVIVTLALGIGANAAMFSIVQGVLLRPLVNRDESRLIYIRQSAPGIDVENTTFSVPELMDLRSRMKTVTAIGDFSTFG